MRILFVSPGFSSDVKHLQPWVWIYQIGVALEKLGHGCIVWNPAARALYTPEGIRDPRPAPGLGTGSTTARLAMSLGIDVAVWSQSPTFAARTRQHVRAVPGVAYVPGPLYGRRELASLLHTGWAGDVGLYGAHLASAMLPAGTWIPTLQSMPIVVPTRTTAERLTRAAVDLDQVHVVACGVDPDVPLRAVEGEPGAERVLRAAGVLGQRFIVNFGPPAAIRGVPTLIRAMDHVDDDDLHALFLVRRVPGEYQRATNRMHALIARSSAADRIHVQDTSLDRTTLFACLRKAWVAALPFEFVQSSVPIALLESMQLGVPVVTSAVDCLPETVEVGGGTAARPGDARDLARVIGQYDSETREVASKRASVHASHLPTWENSARTLLSILESEAKR